MAKRKEEVVTYPYNSEKFHERFCADTSIRELDYFVRLSKDVLVEEIYNGCDTQRNNIILILMYMGFHSVDYNKQCSCSLHELLVHALYLKPYTANYNTLINVLSIMQEHNFIEYDEEELTSKKQDDTDTDKKSNKYIDNVNFMINPMIFNPDSNFIMISLDTYNLISSINPRALIVYIDIMRTMNNSNKGVTAGMSYPSIEKIASNCGYSEKTVEKMIREIETNNNIINVFIVTRLEATFGIQGVKPIHRNIYQNYNYHMGNWEDIKIKEIPDELVSILFKDRRVFTIRDLDTKKILWHREGATYNENEGLCIEKKQGEEIQAQKLVDQSPSSVQESKSIAPVVEDYKEVKQELIY